MEAKGRSNNTKTPMSKKKKEKRSRINRHKGAAHTILQNHLESTFIHSIETSSKVSSDQIFKRNITPERNLSVPLTNYIEEDIVMF